jgi:site-specific DNA-methyltransferase (cytosine-N4-specific)
MIALKGEIRNSSQISKWAELDSINWDFKGADTQYLTHRFHSYPARFIPQIPQNFIRRFTKEGDTVFDPMCGCGTTLVEAILEGRNALGYEFNPLACLITKVKTTPIQSKELRKFLNILEDIKAELGKEKGEVSLLDFTGKKSFIEPSQIIEGLQRPKRILNDKFTSTMERELAIIKAHLDTLEGNVRNFAYVCFSSTIRTIIESKNRITDVYRTFNNKARSMIAIMEDFSSKVKPNIEANVCYGDARRLGVASNSVDLIVMSPPYVNALDYYREHMYNMMWLGMDYSAFKEHEIGGHSHFIFNRWRLFTEYLADMFRSINEMKRVLKKGSVCVIVVGNSTIEYEIIESYKHFIRIGEIINFPMVRVYPRNIDITRKYTSREIGNIEDEYIVVFEKMDEEENPISDNMILEFVITELESMKDRIRKHPGTCTRRKKVPIERLLKNIDRIDEAISLASKDIKMGK